MSQVAGDYVRRHVLHRVNPSKKTVMGQLAIVADDRGRVQDYTQRNAAHDAGLALPTVKRAFQGLLHPPPGAPGPFLIKRGRGRYTILGVEGHDQWTCDSDECRGEAEARRAAGGSLSEKKRRQAAARMRAMRARRRTAAAGVEWRAEPD